MIFALNGKNHAFVLQDKGVFFYVFDMNVYSADKINLFYTVFYM